jgi:hypothetical protein
MSRLESIARSPRPLHCAAWAHGRSSTKTNAQVLLDAAERDVCRSWCGLSNCNSCYNVMPWWCNQQRRSGAINNEGKEAKKRDGGEKTTSVGVTTQERKKRTGRTNKPRYRSPPNNTIAVETPPWQVGALAAFGRRFAPTNRTLPAGVRPLLCAVVS